MVYRYQMSRNPKALLLPLIALAITGGSIAIIVFYEPIVGIIALAVSAYISYHIVKFFVNTVKSHVRTSDEGIVCATTTGSESRLTWDELTHAGWYTTDSGFRELFIYAEGVDRLLTIPPYFDDVEDLEREIAEQSGLSLLTLSGDDVDGLTDALRDIVAPEGEIIEDDSMETDDPD